MGSCFFTKLVRLVLVYYVKYFSWRICSTINVLIPWKVEVNLFKVGGNDKNGAAWLYVYDYLSGHASMIFDHIFMKPLPQSSQLFMWRLPLLPHTTIPQFWSSICIKLYPISMGHEQCQVLYFFTKVIIRTRWMLSGPSVYLAWVPEVCGLDLFSRPERLTSYASRWKLSQIAYVTPVRPLC